MYKTVDLFAGCGGMSLGFQKAGYDLVGAFELWETAAVCYEDNFPDHPLFRMDLSEVDAAVLQIMRLAPEVIIGGPPCQDFSHAGKRIEAGRASLTESFSEIVAQVHPSYFVMENVDRAAQSHAFALAKENLIAAGYGLTDVILDASRCGVPQKRKRFFCIGALGKQTDFLRESLLADMTSEETTLRDYFGDQLGFEYYYRHPRNYNRRGIFSIDEPAPTMRGMNRPVPQGYPGHPNDPCPLSPSLRALTTQERAMIQTFPADFKWSGSKTDVEQMIGNAVPVDLAFYVADHLKAFMVQTAQDQRAIDPFYQWLSASGRYAERSAKDIVSRLKRADSFVKLTGIPDPYYIFQMEQKPDFQALSGTVKSQVKRAVLLYADYYKQAEQGGARE